jgi:hypothetical protein
VGVAQLLEHGGVRRELALGRALPRRQAQPLVQDHPQLWRRVEVELLAGVRVDLLLQVAHPVADRLGHLVQVLDVELHAGGLHPGQHPGQRQLCLVEQ